MNKPRLAAVLGLAALLASCGDLPPSEAALRHVILFNDSAPNVQIASDVETLKLVLDAVIARPSDVTKAQMKAAEVDGKLFKVDNGTRADVLKEVPFGKVAGVSLLRIRIRNGPRITEEGILISTLTQPDFAAK